MIAVTRTTTPPATPAPAPDADALLAERFTGIATRLTASDATLEGMVAAKSIVGTGWAPHLMTIAGELQSARDVLVAAHPDKAKDLAAQLGVDVLKLAEAGGSMSVMARQRATLSEGWSTFLDTAIADATSAAKLLTPAKDPDPVPPTAPAPAPAPAAAATTTAADEFVGEPGDPEYCRTPGFTPRIP